MTDRDPSPPVLVLDGLTRRYGSLTALGGVGLRLPAGARHAVIGPNGAGKTTLLNLIAGTERPDHGTIVLGGRDLTRTATARRARYGIARSFQQPSAIGELTVLDNIVLAAWRHHPRRERVPVAREQLAAVGLGDVAHHPAADLSHGRRRLLDLAAALVCRPRLLLLDEPAAGLTDQDIGRLLDVLGQLSGEVAMLLVEHHTGVVARLADTVTVLKDGKALLTAPTDVALGHPDVREAYLGKGTDYLGKGTDPCSTSAG
ncbi:ABC transporter ATP-binding protein [Streptomyces sp. NPDC050658]|uniref:ABC transporter ATP-binding protein n=1 Tax=unclassified Streptomyces TaxID=2593676 RepID=UPI00342A1D9B